MTLSKLEMMSKFDSIVHFELSSKFHGVYFPDTLTQDLSDWLDQESQRTLTAILIYEWEISLSDPLIVANFRNHTFSIKIVFVKTRLCGISIQKYARQ